MGNDNLIVKYFSKALTFLTVVIVLFLVSRIVNKSYQQNTYMEWYNSLPEEQQIVEREKDIQKYELINVHKYILPKTNGYGGVVGGVTSYNFQYMDGNDLKTFNDFRETKNGTQQIIVGDTNMYIIDNFNLDTHYYLQLTEETLRNIDLQKTSDNP
jgi:hypothetical protein